MCLTVSVMEQQPPDDHPDAHTFGLSPPQTPQS